MKQLYAIIILIFLFAGYAKSQETHGTQQSVTTQDEVNSSINIDIAKIKLPPLSVLYENARSTPSIEILEKEKQLQKKLLAKEKRSWMSLFNAFGNVSHGIADNIGSSTVFRKCSLQVGVYRFVTISFQSKLLQLCD